MLQSSKPRYQRRYRMGAPMHVRQHFMHVHVDKALRTKLKLSKRSVQISKGDTVKIMTGSKKGESGKVASVSMKTGKITIQGLNRKNARGKESPIFISAHNVYITDLSLTDKYRAGKLKLAVQAAAPVPKKEEKKAEPAPADQAAAPKSTGAAPSAQSAAQVKQQVQQQSK